MMPRRIRRIVLIIFLLGSPLAGWLLQGDRGLLFGLIVGALAMVWLLLEDRKIL